VATVAVRHARELVREYDVTLVSDTFPDHSDSVGVRHADVVSPRFDFLRRFGHAPTELAFVRAVRHRLEALHAVHGIRLVMCHSHTVAALAARFLKARYQIPYALVVHGDIFDRPRGTYDPWLTALYKTVTPRAYMTANLVLAVSPHMARRAIEGGASPEAVVVVPNGIDGREIGLEVTAGCASRAAPTGRINILYVGRYSIEKGVRVLVAALGLLKTQGLDCALRMVGQGPLESELRRTVHDLQLSPMITFERPVRRDGLAYHYEWADIVCVPSLSDPLPTVVLEAFVASRPVVGSDVGGIPWMVEDGVTGRIVPPGSAESLARVFSELASRPDRLRIMGVNAAASAARRFSWPTIGDRIRRAVREVVGSR
jgi:glycosyltransferase involved in cell wall biosynthesis